jgi:hypothetical protein
MGGSKPNTGLGTAAARHTIGNGKDPSIEEEYKTLIYGFL